MNVKQIVIEGLAGDIKITRTEEGATVVQGEKQIAFVPRVSTREAIYKQSLIVCRSVYGADRKGNVNATNSMVYEVTNELERMAGC